MSGARGGTLKTAVPQPAPHQDIHQSVSPVLAAWGPGIAYSRIMRYQWIAPGAPEHGIDALGTAYDPNLSASARQIVCDICVSWEMVEPTSLSITLRDDVRWHDPELQIERNLTAEDVVFSINRLRNAKIINSHLVNTVAGIEAVSDNTIEITLLIPDAEILDKLADARAAVMAPEVLEDSNDLIRGPTVGTGPWVMESFDAGRMRFAANRDYFIPELPLLDGLNIAVVPDAQTRVAAFRTGQLDLIQPGLADLMAAVERFDEMRWTTSHDASAGIEVAINTNREVLDSPMFRAALMKAWDPIGLIDTLHSGQSFVSAGLPIHDPDWLLPADEVASYFNDRSGLMEILDGYRAPVGTLLNIKVGEFGESYIRTAHSIANAIRAVGLLASIERVSTRVFAEDIWINGDYDIYVGAPPPQSSTTSTLFAVHHSAAPWNSTGYSTDNLDRLIEMQAIELDAENRRDLLLEIQREIFDGAHLVRAAANVSHWLWWSHLQNVAPNTFRADSFWLTRLWIGERVRG